MAIPPGKLECIVTDRFCAREGEFAWKFGLGGRGIRFEEDRLSFAAGAGTFVPQEPQRKYACVAV